MTLTSRASNRMSLSERLELTFGTSGFLLREILLDFCSFLSKVLVGSHNQELLVEGLSCLKSESVVELVMLLCSQEWQNSLQRHAGSAFMDLINEGRMVSHATRERLVLTTSEALFILQKLRELNAEKHDYFQSASDLSKDTFVNKGEIHDHITSATREKDQNTAKRQFLKVCKRKNPMLSLLFPVCLTFHSVCHMFHSVCLSVCMYVCIISRKRYLNI